MDVNNATIMDSVWDVIANKEAIAVNQAWFGHPGGPFKESSEQVVLSEVNTALVESGALKRGGLEEYNELLKETGMTRVAASQYVPPPALKCPPQLTPPSRRYLYKPMSDDNTKFAVLLMNSADDAADLELNFADIPGFKAESAAVRSIWSHTDLGTFLSSSPFSINVKSHDAAFLMVTVA
jgi:hypothetical protein